MTNLEILQEAGVLTKVTRPLEFSEYSPRYAGKTFQVWVNAPGVLDDFVEATGETFPLRRKVVSVLFELGRDVVDSMSDDLVTWLYTHGWKVRKDYLADLRKNS